MEVRVAVGKASYLIAKKIAVASKPFSDGKFVMNCLLKAIEIVSRTCQYFANKSLTKALFMIIFQSLQLI